MWLQFFKFVLLFEKASFGSYFLDWKTWSKILCDHHSQKLSDPAKILVFSNWRVFETKFRCFFNTISFNVDFYA